MNVAKIMLATASHHLFCGFFPQQSVRGGWTLVYLRGVSSSISDEGPCTEPLDAFPSLVDLGESASGSPPATSQETVTDMQG